MKKTLKELEKECERLSQITLLNPTQENYLNYQNAYKEYLDMLGKITKKVGGKW